MAEVLEFRVPTGHGRTLLVLGLETDATEHALYLAFSAFGPLYSVRLHQNAPVAEPGYYALVKYYSARDAGRAQRACHQQSLFQKSPLKVRICTRQGPFPQQTLVLNSHKCQELANHYLGFNAWSNRIVTLQDISGLEEEETEEEGSRALPQSQHRKYLCIQELTIPRHGICARGIAVAEVPVDPSQGFLAAMRGAQKLAAQKALSDAFQKILLIVLENGKVAVEFCSSQEDLVDCLADEEFKGLLQVTDFSFSHLNHEGEEEVLSDFSLDGE